VTIMLDLGVGRSESFVRLAKLAVIRRSFRFALLKNGALTTLCLAGFWIAAMKN
jgi:hypothetical protein